MIQFLSLQMHDHWAIIIIMTLFECSLSLILDINVHSVHYKRRPRRALATHVLWPMVSALQQLSVRKKGGLSRVQLPSRRSHSHHATCALEKRPDSVDLVKVYDEPFYNHSRHCIKWARLLCNRDKVSI